MRWTTNLLYELLFVEGTFSLTSFLEIKIMKTVLPNCLSQLYKVNNSFCFVDSCSLSVSLSIFVDLGGGKDASSG